MNRAWISPLPVMPHTRGDLGWRTGLLLLLLGLACQGSAPLLRPDGWRLAGALIAASGLVLLPGLVRGFQRPAGVLLADHFQLLAVSFILYFVVGALLIPFGPRSAAEYSLAFFPLDARAAARAMAVNDIGLGLALLACTAGRHGWIPRAAAWTVALGRNVRVGSVVGVFSAVGGLAAMGVAAWDLGYTGRDVIPGSLRLLAQLLNVAVVLAAARSGNGESRSHLLALFLVVAQSALGLVLLSKTAILLPWVALVLGLSLRWGVLRALLPGSLGVALLFVLLSNPVIQGRVRFSTEGPVRDAKERLWFLGEAISNSRSGEDDPFFAWSRICYLPAQGAAMSLHDQGRGGTDFSQAGWAFLPRFLFADKPTISLSGRSFEQSVTGLETSASSPGVFADGYYNLGWPGVVLVGLAVGGMLACTSAFAREVFRNGSAAWLPVALLGSLMAFRVDGQFLTDYLGPFAVFLYLMMGGLLLAGLIRRKGKWQ